MRFTHRLLFSLLFLLWICSPLTAQTTTGTVTGIVTDPGGGPIPQAKVTLTNEGTGIAQTANTNETGSYVFPLVPPGAYQISVEQQGFQRFVRSFKLEVAQQARIDAQLAVGQITESIEVSAGAVLLETNTSNLGQVISNRQVMELPLNGRNPFALAALTPGVTPLNSFGAGIVGARGAAQSAGANNFLANGGMTGANEILLDGIPITVCCQSQPALIPTIETTEEFKVQTNTSPAEFGRTSGGILNILTKSGTNRFHGSAYEFFRNEKLDAANFFVNRAGTNPIPGRDDRRTPLRYNQWGAAAGGPVILPKIYNGKDRTFFFANFEITNVRRSLFRTFSVPTAAMRTGNFSEAPFDIYDPATTTPTTPGRFTRTPFANKIIPADQISPVARNILNLYPMPQRPGIVNNLDSVATSKDDDKQLSFRGDHNFSESYRIFGRYSTLWNDHFEPNYWNSVSSPGGFNQFIRSHTFVLDQIWTIQPTLLFNFRYGFARQRNFRDPYSLGTDLGALGFSQQFVSQVQERFLPVININNNAFNGNDEPGNQRFTRYSHNVAAAVSLVRSAHNMKFGWDGRMFIDHNASLQSPAGNFSFNPNFTNGPDPQQAVPGGQASYLSFASFLLGLPTSGQLTYSDATSQTGYYHALYFQDDWRVTSKLTINLGLRWEVETGPTERYNRIATVEPDIPSPLAQSTGLPLHGGLQFRGVDGAPRGRYKTDANNFGPRAGFAYSLNPKTVFRGGFGVFYAPGLVRLFNGGNPGFTVQTPFVATIDSVTPVGDLQNPFPNGLQPLAGSSQGAATLVGTNVAALTYETPLPYSTQWNFSVQRELPASIAVNISYAGNRGVKLPINQSLNALNPIYYGAPGDSARVAELNGTVPNPFFNIITSGPLAASQVQRNQLLRAFPHFIGSAPNFGFATNFKGVGNSTYHALQVSVQKRMSHGLLSTFSYTFSKNIGNVNMLTTSFSDPAQNPGYQNEFNRALDRSVLGSDFPHRVVLSAVYDLPFGRNHKIGGSVPGWVNTIIGGWQTNGIFAYQSGQPLNFGVAGAPPYAGTRASFTGTTPIQTEGDITDRLGGASGGPGYLNASAFRVPRSFEFGDTPRLDSQNRGPSSINLDFSLIKNFFFTESTKLQFRAEAFNISNTPVFGLPLANTTVGNPGFGVIGTQVNQPRNLQLALKFIW